MKSINATYTNEVHKQKSIKMKINDKIYKLTLEKITMSILFSIAFHNIQREIIF